MQLFPHLRGRDRSVFQVRFQKQGWRSGRYFLQYPCQHHALPFAALAGAGAVPRVQYPVFSPSLRGSQCWRSWPPVSRAAGGVSAISWLSLPAAELRAGTRRWCSRQQPAGRGLATGRAACRGARLRRWDAEEEEKQPLSQNMIQIIPFITWLLSRAWGRGSFQSPGPLKSYVLPSGNAWWIEDSSLCRYQQTP